MAKLNVFNFITLNGFFQGPGEDISWHRHGEEESQYAGEGANSDSIILLGRVTYEMMAGWWPTPEAIKTMPAVAEGMNNSEKIVFSKTLKKATWNNTRLIGDNIIEETGKLKVSSGKDMIILGSGSIVSQFAEAGIIDEYLIMLDPVALGDGTPILKNIRSKLDLRLINSRVFKSGVVLLTYGHI
jgi:dihydrofolate reductase